MRLALHHEPLAGRASDGRRYPSLARPANRRLRPRRGATIVEAALTLTILVTMILGTIDLGLGIMQFNMISHGAREGVRQAMVHGTNAITPWPALPFPVSADSIGYGICAAVSPQLVGCDLTQTTIKMEFVDGSNDIGNRVRVTVSTTYQPLLTYLFGAGPQTLTAAATSRFAH
jgi:Flp pilus assembly protein TadG